MTMMMVTLITMVMMLYAGVDTDYDNDSNDNIWALCTIGIWPLNSNCQDKSENDYENDGIYQSPLSRPLADEPDEQINVVHADYQIFIVRCL